MSTCLFFFALRDGYGGRQEARYATMWLAVLRTVQRMMLVRGYPMQDADIRATAETAFSLSTRPNYVHHLFTGDNNHMVHLNNESKVGIKSIRVLIDQMKENEVTHAICVFMQPPTPFARRFLSNLKSESENLHIEYFYSHELIFDITQHKLMPRHVRLTEEEKQAVVQRYGKQEHFYPKIQLSDPMARYLGLQKGHMIRVERSIPHLGQSVTYRIACSSSSAK